MLEDFSDDNEHDLESMESESPYPDIGAQSSYNQSYQTFSERYTNQQLAAYRGNQSVGDSLDSTMDDNSLQRQLVLRGDFYINSIIININKCDS